jgi:hypothetical protein
MSEAVIKIHQNKHAKGEKRSQIILFLSHAKPLSRKE